MKLDTLDKYTRGWIVGNFSPSIIKTDNYEIGIKYYTKDDYEKSHKHLKSSEITIVVFGHVQVNKKDYYEKDIIIQEIGDSADFKCMSDRAIVTVLRPDGSFPNDKYYD